MIWAGIVADLIFVVSGEVDLGPVEAGAISCRTCLRLETAFSSHLGLPWVGGVGVFRGEAESRGWLSEAGVDCSCFGLRMGTKADLTTSMGSSSESSEDGSWLELRSRDELTLAVAP